MLQDLDESCDRFEAAWCSGASPRIEDYIAGEHEPLRSQLLRELVALEVAYRRQRGQTPDYTDYETRFASDSAIVCEGFDGGFTQTTPEYRNFCGEMIARFRDSDDYGIVEQIGSACVPAPDATTNPEEVVRCVRMTGQHRLVGAALYRAQHDDQAGEEFSKASQAGYQFAAGDHAFLAMALLQLDRDAAQHSLTQAHELSNRTSTWHEEVEVTHLIREAEVLLKAKQGRLALISGDRMCCVN